MGCKSYSFSRVLCEIYKRIPGDIFDAISKENFRAVKYFRRMHGEFYALFFDKVLWQVSEEISRETLKWFFGKSFEKKKRKTFWRISK